MKKGIAVIALLTFFLFSIIGCQNRGVNDNASESAFDTVTETIKEPGIIEEEVKEPEAVKVNTLGREFTVEELVEGFEKTFNNKLYYRGEEGIIYEYFFGGIFEYEMYYKPNLREEGYPALEYPMIYVAFPDTEYITSTPEEPQIYFFGANLTEYGLSSTFNFGYHAAKDDYIPEDSIYLGKFTLTVDEVTKPEYSFVTEEWKAKAEEEIQIYMDENDASSTPERNLEPGNYNVYVKNFTEADIDSTIYFEHENGNVYYGHYYYARYILESPGISSADLNHVELYVDHENPNENDIYITEVLEKVKLDPALAMQYTVS